MSESDLVKTTIDQLLSIRTNIHLLMTQSKSVRANGKFFAYKKCYNMLSSVIYPLNEKLAGSEKRDI